ncbi:MAG: ABC transporter ATP-binding protein [Gaiellaceae bacterium]
MAAVTYEATTKRFGEVVALSSLDLRVEDGEFMVLLGPSGSGKTTALRIAAGFEAVSDGRILIGEREVNRVPPAQRDVAMVFQDYALYPQMTVEQNMGFGLKMRRVKRAEIRDRVHRAADTLGLEDLLARRPAQLSGGQRQRVALGRALVREPKVYLMDEPLSNLDAALRIRMRSEIKELQQTTGTTAVYVTHDQTEAMTLGTRIAVMRLGVLEQVGTPEAIYQRPANAFVAGFVGTPPMSFLTCTCETRDTETVLRHGAWTLPSPIAVDADSVIVGVRSENVGAWNDGGTAAGPFEGTVRAVEALGRETFASVDLGAGEEVTVQLGGLARVELGERLRFGIDPRALYLFDSGNGRSLAWPHS